MDKTQLYAKRLSCLVKINQGLEKIKSVTQMKKKAEETSEECDIVYIQRIKEVYSNLDDLQKLL